MNSAQIPCIDLTPARLGSKKDKYKVALELDKIAKDVGFFTVVGHGIPLRTIEQAHFTTDTFFKLSIEDKNKCKEDINSPHNERERHPILLGYSGLFKESIYESLGGVDNKQPRDGAEKFSIRKRMFDGSPVDLLFPSASYEVQFKSGIQPYYSACENFFTLLAELFAIALNLPVDYISNRINNSYDIMRLLKYPTYDKDLNGSQRLPEHTDGSLFTLIASTSSGIEYKLKDDSWVSSVMNSLDCLFVNLGDTLKRWSNDVYISAAHKVVLPESEERQSIVFFKRVNDDTLMEVFPKCCEMMPAKYPPIIYKQFIDEFYTNKIKALIR